MTGKELREMDANELQLQLNQVSENLFRLRFQLAMGQSDVLTKYRGLKKDRARVLTVMAERKAAR